MSWTHVKSLLAIKSDDARAFYAEEAASEHLSVRELQAAIGRNAYERREIANSQVPSGSAVPRDAFRDPLILDLLFFSRPLRRPVAVELKIGRFDARFEGQMKLYLKWLDRYERQEGEEAPIGLILCTEVSREQVELLEMHKDGIIAAE